MMEGKGRRGRGKGKQMDAKFLIKASWPRTNYEAWQIRREIHDVSAGSQRKPPSPNG